MDLDALAQALRQRGCPAARVGQGLIVWRVGPGDAVAWVSPQGDVVIAGTRELSDRAALYELKVVYHTVLRLALPTIAPEDRENRFHRLARIYTRKPDQYQKLWLRLPDDVRAKFVLDWPDGEASWAHTVYPFVPSTRVIVGGKPIDGGRWRLPPEDAESPVRFGTHEWGFQWARSSMEGRRQYASDFGDFFVLDTFFAEPGGRIALLDQTQKSVVEGQAFSLSLAELRVPRPPAPPKIDEGTPPKSFVKLADLGFRTACAAHFGIRLAIPPVRRALASKFQNVYDAGESVFVPRAGPKAEAAWVFPDGRVLVAATYEIAGGYEQYDRFLDVGRAVGRMVTAVNSEIREENAVKAFREARVFTQQPDQFQRLGDAAIAVPAAWCLSWPRGQAAWRVADGQSDWQEFDLEVTGTSFLRMQRNKRTHGDLPDLAPGDHAISAPLYAVDSIELGVQAFFPEPQGRIALFGPAGIPWAEDECFSQALTEIWVPACEAYRDLPSAENTNSATAAQPVRQE
jgi:hypothetical protein